MTSTTTTNPTAAPIETHVLRTTVALRELQPGDVLIDEPGAPEVTSAAASGEVLGTTRDGEPWSAIFDVDESHLRIDRTVEIETSPHVAELEACFVRALDALNRLGSLRARVHVDATAPGPLPVNYAEWVRDQLDAVIDAFGEQS